MARRRAATGTSGRRREDPRYRLGVRAPEGGRLAKIGPAATVFGSARTPEAHPQSCLIGRVGAELGRAGYAVITGGGPGLMEAAHRGARDAGALSVGCSIELPNEDRSNDYLDISLRFRRFFERK